MQTEGRPFFLVDESVYNGLQDHGALADEGYAGAIVKVSEGTSSKTNPNAAEQIRRAKANLQVVGIYHFLWNMDVSPIKEQVDAFLRFGEKDFILAIDVESYPAQIRAGGAPDGASVRAFIRELRRRGIKRTIVIYSGAWYWRDQINNPDLSDLNVVLWSSRYVSGDGDYGWTLYQRMPKAWWDEPQWGHMPPDLLQISPAGFAAGHYPWDINVFSASLERLKLLGTGGYRSGEPKDGPTSPTEPDPRPEWDQNWQVARMYGRHLCDLGIRYWHWDGGDLDRTVDGRPAAVDGPPPRTLSKAFCADLVTLSMRRAGLKIPKNHGTGFNYDGGTRSFMLAYRDVMRPFKIAEFRDGDAAFVDFEEKGPGEEGHIMINDKGRALQSFAWNGTSLEPGVNRDFTVEESHRAYPYFHRIPREKLWTPR